MATCCNIFILQRITISCSCSCTCSHDLMTTFSVRFRGVTKVVVHLTVHILETIATNIPKQHIQHRTRWTWAFVHSTWTFLINSILMWTLLNHNSLSFEPFIFLVIVFLCQCERIWSRALANCTITRSGLQIFASFIAQCSWCGTKHARFVSQYAHAYASRKLYTFYFRK